MLQLFILLLLVLGSRTRFLFASLCVAYSTVSLMLLQIHRIRKCLQRQQQEQPLLLPTAAATYWALSLNYTVVSLLGRGGAILLFRKEVLQRLVELLLLTLAAAAGARTAATATAVASGAAASPKAAAQVEDWGPIDAPWDAPAFRGWQLRQCEGPSVFLKGQEILFFQAVSYR